MMNKLNKMAENMVSGKVSKLSTILLAVILLGLITLVGCMESDIKKDSQPEIKKEEISKPKVITEYHKIIEIKDGMVRAELVTGTGEGIYYTEEQLKDAEPFKVGDTIEISWTEEDFNNENWDNIYSVEWVE